MSYSLACMVAKDVKVCIEEREYLSQWSVDVSGETRSDHLVSQLHQNQETLFVQFQMGRGQMEPCMASCADILNLNFVSSFSEDAATQANIR